MTPFATSPLPSENSFETSLSLSSDGFGQDGACRGLARDVCDCGAGCQNANLQGMLVPSLGQHTTNFGRVVTAHVVVVLGFVDLGDEHRRDQQVVDGDDLLVVFDGAAEDFVTGRVVIGRRATHNRERCRFARGDRARHHAVLRLVLGFEDRHDLAREYLHEQFVGEASAQSLAEAGCGCISHSGVSL